MTIDTRYPPQPQPTEVPLYPSRPHMEADPTTPDSVQQLSDTLQAHFGSETDNFVLGASASALLQAHLQHTSAARSQRVALPIFSCQSLVDAVVGSGSSPIFYDIEPDGSIGTRGVNFAIHEQAQTYVWPAFFGSRQRDQALIDRLHNAGSAIVFDDAQANPFDTISAATRASLTERDIALYSFGGSKLVAGAGGGALIAGGDIDSLQTAVANNSNREQLEVSQPLEHFATQDSLLESRQPQHNPALAMAAGDARHNISQIQGTLNSSARHAERFARTRQAIAHALGKDALDYIGLVSDTPSIMAVQVKPRTRYDFMAALATQGVQTTWYYYPINRVSRYQCYPAQQDIGSAAIAASVVVLPFQWTHSDAQIAKLNQVLDRQGTGHGS